MDSFKNDFDRMYETMKDVQRKFEHMDNQITLLRIDVAGLKIKATGWGILGGAVSALLMIVIEMFRR